jgi:hypothetical protein
MPRTGWLVCVSSRKVGSLGFPSSPAPKRKQGDSKRLWHDLAQSVIKHAHSIAKVHEELKLYRESDGTSEMVTSCRPCQYPCGDPGLLLLIVACRPAWASDSAHFTWYGALLWEAGAPAPPRLSVPSQAGSQPRIPSLRTVIMDSDAQSFLLPDQHQQPLAPRYACVDQVAL